MINLYSEKGSAMIISLVVLLMLGIIGVAAVQNSNTEMDIAQNYQIDMKSFYIAEAGVELAYTILRDTATWRTGFTNYPFAGGDFDITLVDSLTNPALDDTILVYSTGRRSGAMTRIEVKLAPQSPFDWGAHGDDYLTACGGTMTDSYNSDSGSYVLTRLLAGGNVGSNGPLMVCGTADIYGGAATSEPGELDINGGAVVTGDTTSMAPEILYPPITDAAFEYARNNTVAPAGFAGDYDYDPANFTLNIKPHETLVLSSGIYYFTDINVQGSIELAPGAQATIYMDGDITMAAHTAVNAGGNAANLLIMGGDGYFNLSAFTDLCAAVYAPETVFKLTGHAELFGSFIANEVHDVGGSSFHYDRALRDLEFPGDYVKVAWREL